MASFLDLTRNFSFYTIPAAWVLAIAPHVYATSLHDAKSPTQKFNPCSPRTLVPSLDSNPSLDTATKQTIIRAEAAQQNGFENIGLFAAAVVAGNVAKVDSWWLNTLSFGYLGSRVVYNLLYIGGAGGARTAAFLSGVGMVMTLFVKAGNAVRDKVV
jgi:uncharacterized MAPEG superfamily protein